MIADLNHNFGEDLQINATGNLATATGTSRSQQRVLRRLLTNPGDYIWHPEYGAGLPRFIGQPVSPLDIAAVVRAQIALEPAVAQVPAPVVTVQSNNDTAIFLTITYTDADTGQTEVLNVPVG